MKRKVTARKFASVALAFLLTAVHILGLFSVTVAATDSASGTCGDNLTWTLDEDGTLTISGTGDMVNYEPTETPWYPYRESITSVVIEDGVTSIGDCAFYQHTSLASITIPGSVTNIRWNALNGCSSLTSITIPASVTSIGWQALSYCTGLTSITVDANNEYYSSEDDVLFNKDKTELVLYPTGKAVAEYTIPSSVTSIGDYAFLKCGALTSVTIPNSVESMGSGAFEECRNLTSIVIPGSIESIDWYAFSNCSSLTSITFESATTEIYDLEYTIDSGAMIYGYTGSTAQAYATKYGRMFVVIGEEPVFTVVASGECGDNVSWELNNVGVLRIFGTGDMWNYDWNNSSPFYENQSIKSVVIEDGVTSIGDRAFDSCNKMTGVIIADSVTSIGMHAFDACWKLASIEIPAGVASIGDGAFSNCSSLSGFTVNADSPYFCAVDGVLFNKEMTELVCYSCGKYDVTSYTVPNGVEKIRANAMQGAWFSELILPSSLEYIDNLAVFACRNITSLTIPEGVTHIGYNAFLYCENLETVTIASTVTEIGSDAFANCTNLESLTIKAPFVTIVSWSDNPPANVTIYGYTGSTAEDLAESFSYGFVSLGEIQYTVVDSGSCGENVSWELNNVGVLRIFGTGNMRNYDWDNSSPFYENQSIKSVVIEDGVTSIGNLAFASCLALTEVTFPSSLERIGSQAFNNCNHITSLTIPEGVTHIDYNAFSGCYSLETVELPSTLTELGSNAFSYCPKFKSLTIKAPFVTIDSWSIVPPANVTIYGYTGSTAEDLAERYSYGFVSLGNIDIPYTVVASGKCGDNVSWELNNAGALRIFGTGEMNNYRWNIMDSPFRGNTRIRSVVIENGVTSIGDYAFEECRNITEITIADSVTSIGEYAFDCCQALASIEIPANVSSIGRCAFANCGSLSGFTVNAGSQYFCAVDGVLLNKYMTELVCYSCGKYDVTSYTVPDGVKKILENSMQGARFSELILPSSLEYIDNWAVFACMNITSLTIPEGVTYIGDGAFMYCENLETVTIASTVTEIGSDAFANCTKLESITINSPYTTIYHSSTTIPESATIYGYAGSTAETYATQFGREFVNVDSGDVEELGENMTWSLDASGTLRITGTGDMPDWTSSATVPWFGQRDSIKSVVISNGVTSIGNYAFAGCENLGSSGFGIPSSVTRIGDGVFSGCIKLTSVTFQSGINLVSVGNDAFRGCVALRTIALPATVTSIGDNAFRGCVNLTEMTIPESTTTIGNYAFADCDKLTTVSYYNGGSAVSTVGKYAFSGCTNLSQIVIPQGITEISEGMYQNCSGAKHGKIVIRDGVTAIRSNAFAGCSGVFSFSIPSSVTEISGGAFSNCEMLYSVELGSGSTAIAASAFDGTTMVGFVSFGTESSLNFGSGHSLTDNALVIKTGDVYVCRQGYELDGEFVFTTSGDLVAYIGGEETVTLPTAHNGETYLLSGVRGVRNVIIPAGVEINDNAFSGNVSLLSVSFEDGWNFTCIGKNAFKNCTRLYAFAMPNSIETIDEYAFYGTALRYADANRTADFTVSNNIKYVRAGAFYECYNLPFVHDWDLSTGNIPYEDSVGNMRYLMSNDGTFSILLYRYMSWRYMTSSYDSSAFIGVDMHLRPDLRVICDHAFDTTETSCSDSNYELHIPATVAYIGDYGMRMQGYEHHHSLIFDTFEDGTSDLREIGAYAFEGTRRSQGEVVLPEGLVKIGDHAFMDTWEITSVVIPSTVKEIGDHAFYGNPYSEYQKPISSVTFAENCQLETIGDYAFYGTLISEIDIPSGVTSIGTRAFGDCPNIKSVIIPAGVDSLVETFKGNEKIERIVLGSVNTVIDDIVDDQVYVLIACSGENESARAYADASGYITFLNTSNGENIIRYNISDGLYAEVDLFSRKYSILGSGEIYWNEDFENWLTEDLKNGSYCKHLYIGKDITHIDSYAVSHASMMLETITVEDGNTAYKASDDGKFLLTIDGQTLVKAASGAKYVPAGVKVIGSQAYYCDTALYSVVLPEGLEKIEYLAFGNAYSLRAISIPDSVTEIESYAFVNCSKLATIVMSGSIETIGENAFLNVGTYTTGDSYYSDATYLFYRGSESEWDTAKAGFNMTGNEYLSSSVMTYDYAEYEQGLTYVSNGDGTCYVSGQEGIEEHPLEEYRGEDYANATERPEGAGKYWDKNELTMYRTTPTPIIHVPAITPDGEAVVAIGDFTDDSRPFRFVLNLKEVYLPEGITLISNESFYCCEEMYLLTLPISVTDVNQTAFKYCRDLADVITKDHVNLHYLGPEAFSACNAFEALYIPKNLWTINNNTFNELTGLMSIEADPENDFYYAAGNCLFNRYYRQSNNDHEREALILGCATSVIPQGTKEIAAQAFWGINGLYENENLTSIFIPKSVEVIGTRGLGFLDGLTEIIFEEGSRLRETGYEAFYFTDITSVRLPDNVWAGQNLFRGCTKLESAYIHTNSIYGTFKNCKALKEVDLYITDTIGNETFRNCQSLTSLTLNEGVKKIDGMAFCESGLVSLRIPASTQSIDDYILAGCQSLKYVYIYNPNISLTENSLMGMNDNVTVFAHRGSTTEAYCKAHGISFIPFPEVEYIDGKPTVTVGRDYTKEWADCLELYAVTGADLSESSVRFDPSLLGDVDTWHKSVEIVTDVGNVTFDDEASDKFQNADSTIEFNLTSVYKQMEHKGKISIEAKVGGVNLFAYEDKENNGMITVTAYIEKGLDPDRIAITYKYENIKESVELVSYDPTSGLVTFRTNHFSDYEIEELPQDGYIASGECGDNLTWTLGYNGTLTISGEGAMAYFGINMPWASYRDSITSVVIEDGVTSIGYLAFQSCESLTSVTIPSSVTSIGWRAFEYCSSLTSITVDAGNANYISDDGVLFNKDKTAIICYPAGKTGTTYTIPDSVTSIGDYAFEYSSSLTSVTIPSSVTSIGNSAFDGCSSLVSITIPSSVTSIGDFAFQWCSGLTSVTIPDSVTSISDYAFRSCRSLTSVTIPSSVTSIGDEAFSDCRGLESITIPDGVMSIGDYAFQSCKSLTSITIPDGVTSIGEHVFSGCSSLVSIAIPSSVTSIGESAFSGCSSFVSITIPSSVTSIGTGVFDFCSHLVSITVDANNANYSSEDGVLFNKDKTAIICYPAGKTGTTYTIPDSVTSIGDEAFYNSYRLTSITIPDSVTSIGDYAFNGCSGLTSITIPDGVTRIGDYAFNGCRGLTSITIPDGVMSIGERAFSGCSSFVSITIPSSVTSIGAGVFAFCSHLVSITVDAGNANYISDDGVLFNKDKTAIICYPAGKTGTTYTIPSSVTSIGNDAFNNCSSLSSITIPSSVTSIGDEAFRSCSSLVSITIPSSVTSMGFFVFESCGNLKVIIYESATTEFPNEWYTTSDSVTIYGYADSTAETYANDLGINFVEIGEGGVIASGPCGDSLRWELDYHGNMVFTGSGAMNNYTQGGAPWNDFRTMITSVSLPDGLTHIGEWAFYQFGNVGEITIPSSVTSIGLRAFQDCSLLVTVNIPANVTSIGSLAFDGCISIVSFTVDSGSASYCAEDGVLFNKAKTELVLYPAGKTETEYTIPSSVKTIFGGALAYAKIENVILPNTLEIIGDNAFYSALLTRVTIPASVTTIGNTAFGECRQMTSVTFEENSSLTFIGASGFGWCAALTTITIPESVTEVGWRAFRSCNSLATIIFESKDTVIASDNASIPTGTVIYGYSGGAVQEWANARNRRFVAIEATPYTISVSSADRAFVGEETEFTVDFSDFNIPAIGLSIKLTYDKDVFEFVSGEWSIEGVMCDFDGTNEKGVIAFDPAQVVDGSVLTFVLKAKTVAEATSVSCDISYQGTDAETYEVEVTAKVLDAVDYTLGDLDGDDKVTAKDAIRLLYHTFFPNESAYAVSQPCDFNGDGAVSAQDAIYLLYYVFYPEDYPLAV